MNSAAQQSSRTARGLANLGHPSVTGSIVGSAGATAFVLVNRGALPGAWPTAALVAWALLLALAVWTVLLRPRRLAAPPRPRPRAGLVYAACIVGMFAGFAVGRLVLDALGHVELQPAVVVLAVGLHFVPFAWAFRVSVFAWLGGSVAALGAVGLAWGWASGEVAAASVAVAAGLVLLATVAATAAAD